MYLDGPCSESVDQRTDRMNLPVLTKALSEQHSSPQRVFFFLPALKSLLMNSF